MEHKRFGIMHKEGTFVFWWIVKNKFKNFLVQFSMEEPWLIPRHESTDTRELYGWLFFYMGKFKYDI